MDENHDGLPFGSEPSGLVDAAWVAQRLGVTLRFVRRLVAEHRIPYVKLGGPVRFERADVERFIENGRRPSAISRRSMARVQSSRPDPPRMTPA